MLIGGGIFYAVEKEQEWGVDDYITSMHFMFTTLSTIGNDKIIIERRNSKYRSV